MALLHVVIGKDEAKQLDIVLQRGIVFRAKVLDSQTGKPVEGVSLWNRQYPGVEGRSDAEGRIEIPGMLPGRFVFEVQADGYPRWGSEQCLSKTFRYWTVLRNGKTWHHNLDRLDFGLKAEMAPVTIRVERGVQICGKVFDPVGSSVAGATVSIEYSVLPC